MNNAEMARQLYLALRSLEGMAGTQSPQERIAQVQLCLAAAPETAAELERVKAVNVELREALRAWSELAAAPKVEVGEAAWCACLGKTEDALARLALSRAEGAV